MVSISEIFNVLSDDKSLMIFNAIAFGTAQELLHKTPITQSQYYLIMSSLLNVGLVRKKDDEFYLTSIGKVFYYAYQDLSRAMDNLWKLKCIDILEESDKMPREEISRVIKTIIADYRIREILIGHH